MQRWKLTIEYHGAAYSGWQRQSEAPSVQQRIEEALHAFCQQELRLFVAGRTDAGVHAHGQVAHVDIEYGDRPLTGYDLTNALNFYLRDSGIAILQAEPVGEDFHARYGAKDKLYTYRILNRVAMPAIEQDRVWHVRKPLDPTLMQEGAKHLLGRHDFTTFRAIGCQANSPIRTLDRLDIEIVELGVGRELRVHTEARSFLHHQVRNMVGALALVGEGKWQPDDVRTALEARDRTKGPATAPADGLSLMAVRY